MAISLIAKPQDITPAYNPIKFIYDSTNNGEAGFRYIFDIYDSTATKIAEYRVLPNLDGYGEIDLSRLLQNYVSYDFDPTSTTYFDASNSYYEYDVNVGEEYVQSYDYTASLTQNGTYVKITYTTQPFAVGDQVVIAQVDGGVANPNLEGLFTVTEANVNDFTVNSLWSEVGDATIDGSVTFADNRKTVTRDIITSTNNFVWNSALSFAEFRTYDKDNYQMVALGAQTDNLCTALDYNSTTFYMTENCDMWINMMQDSNANAQVYFENSDGDLLYKSTPATTLMNMVAVGINNLGTLSVDTGSTPLIKSTTEWYEFWSTSFNAQRSQKYRVYVDRRCTINDYEIVFLDRKGSIIPMAFQLREKLTGQVTKDTYNKNIEGYVSSQEWLYQSYEQGTTVINPRIEETYELNTNWMSEDQARLFAQLVSSPQTWIKIDGTYYACTVEDRGYELSKERNRNLIRKTVRVMLSVQDRING